LSAKILVAQTPADTAIVQQAPVKKIKPVVKKDTARARHSFKKDTTGLGHHLIVMDSLLNQNDTALVWQAGPFKAGKGLLSYRNVLNINPYYNFFAWPENRSAEERPATGKEALFYILAGLLFFFALVKLLFNRYVTNLLGLVFRGSLRQKQIREQLLQTPLPSLFLNIFFVLVGGLYIFFLLQNYKIATHTPFWLLLLYCVMAVGLVYLVKFMILKLTGWIFNMRDAADTYIFIVFLVNKLLAIFLLPLLIIMAFSLSSWGNVLLTLSYIMVILFFTYRYIVSFAPVRREVKVSQFHFFMYLCAFEIIPLLLIYKVLVHFF
jgi:hypothetical protein